jgi:hypothetical protein
MISSEDHQQNDQCLVQSESVDQALHSAREVHFPLAYFQVAPEILADFQVASMAKSQSTGKR